MRRQSRFEDLIRNGGFHGGPADPATGLAPAQWTSWQADSSHGRFGWDARTGEGSALLTGVRDGCLLQSIAARPVQRYFATARARVQGPAEPMIRVRWQTGGGKWIAEPRDVIFYRSFSSEGDWSEIAGVAAVPEGVGRLVLLLGVNGQNAANETVCFDDVHLYPLP